MRPRATATPSPDIGSSFPPWLPRDAAWLLVSVLSVAEWPVHPEPPDVVPRANQAARLKTQKENDDDAVEHAFQLLRAGREQGVHLRAEQAEHKPRGLRQQHDKDGPQHRAERRTEAANDENRKRLDAQQKRKALDADKGKIDPVECAGDAGDEGAGDEGKQLVGVQIDAHDTRGGVVIAYRNKRAADPAAPDIERGEQREDSEAEAEMGKGGIAVEADA